MVNPGTNSPFTYAHQCYMRVHLLTQIHLRSTNNIYHLPYLIFLRSIYPNQGHTQEYENLKNIPYSFLNICKKYMYPKSNVFGYVGLKN
jgi:hypothetical protein